MDWLCLGARSTLTGHGKTTAESSSIGKRGDLSHAQAVPRKIAQNEHDRPSPDEGAEEVLQINPAQLNKHGAEPPAPNEPTLRLRPLVRRRCDGRLHDEHRAVSGRSVAAISCHHHHVPLHR
jgi:hypothetical protein